MDEPPSLSSTIIRNFERQQSQQNDQTYQFVEEQSNPSISDIRSMESQSQSQSQSQYNQMFQVMNIDRSIPQPMDIVQPVSIGDMAIRSEEISIQHSQFPGQRTVGISDNIQQAPPSIGCMVRQGGISEAGRGDFSYDALPSRTDVAHRDASQTGELIGGGGAEFLPKESYSGVSLTGRNFEKFYTMEFPREEA